MRKASLAVFVSGEGSLFQFLAEHNLGELFEIKLLVTSRADVPAVEKASQLQIPIFLYKNPENHEELQEQLRIYDIDFIVLAGFLKKIPSSLISSYPEKIINTHPSLLPKYGGKGMYGLNVHKAVIDAGETETGCTTHFVTENYDEGEIILQKRLRVKSDDTPESLQERVKQLEKQNLLETLGKILP